MKIKLLFFARARELAGAAEAEADVPEGSVLQFLSPTDANAASDGASIEGFIPDQNAGSKAGEAMQIILQKYPSLREIEGEKRHPQTKHHKVSCSSK